MNIPCEILDGLTPVADSVEGIDDTPVTRREIMQLWSLWMKDKRELSDYIGQLEARIEFLESI